MAGARASSASSEYVLARLQFVPRPLEETFAFFSNAHNLESITPPWLRFSILEAPAKPEQGSLIRYELRLFGVPIGWHAQIERWTPPRAFTDVQAVGPYPLWEHSHRFSPFRGGTEIYDHVRYRVPGGPLGPLVQRLLVGRWLDEIFDYRAVRLDELLTLRGGTSTAKSKRSA